MPIHRSSRIEPQFNDGLALEHERWIVENISYGMPLHSSQHYPAHLKPFYMLPSTVSDVGSLSELHSRFSGRHVFNSRMLRSPPTSTATLKLLVALFVNIVSSTSSVRCARKVY